MKYNVGDHLQIVGNSLNHGFNVGDVVVVSSIELGHYRYRLNGGYNWFVSERDLAPVFSEQDLDLGQFV